MTTPYQTHNGTSYKLVEKGRSNSSEPPALADALQLVHPAEWATDRTFLTATSDGQSKTLDDIYLQHPDQEVHDRNITAELDEFQIEKTSDKTIEWLSTVTEVTAAATLTTQVKQPGTEITMINTESSHRAPLRGVLSVLEDATHPMLVQLQCVSVDKYFKTRVGHLNTRRERFEGAEALGDIAVSVWHGNYNQYAEVDPAEYRSGYVLTMRVLAGDSDSSSKESATAPEAVVEQFAESLPGDAAITATHESPDSVMPAVRNYALPEPIGISTLAYHCLPFTTCAKPYVACTSDELRWILGDRNHT